MRATSLRVGTAVTLVMLLSGFTEQDVWQTPFWFVTLDTYG